jgi:hypothetical protein
MTIKVISGFAKMNKALALRIAKDSPAEAKTCGEIVSGGVVRRLFHITRSNPGPRGEVAILLLTLIVKAS